MRQIISASSIFALLILGGPAAAQKAAAPAKAPLAKVSKAHYEVQVQAAGTKAGANAKAQLAIHPKAGYKFNKQYPTKVKLSAPEGVKLAKAVLKKADATQLEDAGATFPVSYTSAAEGKNEVTAKLSFSVCDAKTCEIVKETLSWTAGGSSGNK